MIKRLAKLLAGDEVEASPTLVHRLQVASFVVIYI